MREDLVASMVTTACPGSVVTGTLSRTGGQLSSVFEVQRQAADPVIVKVYEPQWAWKQAKELHIYRLLAGRLAGSVPEILYSQPDGSAPAFTVLTKLPGIPLSEAELPPAAWRRVYRQLGALLAQVHAITQPSYGYLTDRILDPLPSNDQYMRRQFAKKLQEFAELGGAPALLHTIEQYVADHAHLFAENTQPALCHNDFHEGNVLLDPASQQVTGFIDMENAIAADPLIDLAKLWSYSIRDDAAKLAGLIEGYDALPPNWRPRITLYRLYHSLELWDWFCSTGKTEPLDSIAKDLATLAHRPASSPPLPPS